MQSIDLREIWPNKIEVAELTKKMALRFAEDNVDILLAINALVIALESSVNSAVKFGKLPCPDCGECHPIGKETKRHLELVKDGTPETN